MKICGTVRRPLRVCISARFSGADSTSNLSKAAPFDCSRRRARSQ
jgi:hypothetical protein